jgi:glycerol-3-phosphate O-acyltransferase
MSFSLSPERPAIWLLHKIIALWVRSSARPPDVEQMLAGRERPICYVLERESLSDLLVLQDLCVRAGLPRPSRRLVLGNISERRSLFALERSGGVFRQRVDRRTPPVLTALVTAASEDATLDLDLVPVGIFWGRAPQKEGSWFRLLLSENWALVGRFRKFLTVIFNGRNTLLQFGEPLSLRAVLDEARDQARDQARTVRRLSRNLRTQLRNQRAAVIGPDLSHRRTIVSQILATRAVRAAIAQERREKSLSRRDALWIAKGYADEIAANYSHVFVVFMERLLSRLWNRLYDGVELHHEETLHRVAEGNEVVYVPCHRSHMDYLLLSYIIYVKGFAVPHIAAGVNLNMPVIGRFLRKGGAFFIRRSFRGASLYPTVFMKYLGVMLARGHSLEYFIEGGRSRTGRLLEPKTGMLSMTVRSFLTGPRRPVVFVPVYFGYERLVEGETYIGELSGRPKEKESVWGLARTLPKLRRKFGKVHVSIGEPIVLSELLAHHEPRWAELAFDDAARPPWFNVALDDLARRIMVNINGAAAVTPVNLLAVTLLATPRQAMLESDLERQLELYRDLPRAIGYSNRISTTDLSGAAIVRHGEAMQMLTREQHVLGDVISMTEENAVLATYFRNNVLHLYALPSLIACCFLNNAVLRTADVQRLARRIYPYVADEVFLRWREEELPGVVDEVLRVLAARRLLEGSQESGEWHRRPPTAAEAMQLSVLAQGTIQIVERYYLAISILIQAGSGAITPEALEKRCQLIAQRMSMLFELSAPEFFDRSLFASFIDLLRRRGVIQTRADNTIAFNEVLLNVAHDATLVLSEQIRHSILQVAHA